MFVDASYVLGVILGARLKQRIKDAKVCTLLSLHPSGFCSDMKHCAKCFLKMNSLEGVPILVISILQMRKLRHGKVT